MNIKIINKATGEELHAIIKIENDTIIGLVDVPIVRNAIVIHQSENGEMKIVNSPMETTSKPVADTASPKIKDFFQKDKFDDQDLQILKTQYNLELKEMESKPGCTNCKKNALKRKYINILYEKFNQR